MATASDSVLCSLVERRLVISALELKAASVARAGKSETDDAIRSARERQYSEIMALIAKFR